MFYFLLTIHLILCLAMIGLVLLQQGKGAAVGAILSGSSNTLFGATGANTLLVKMTTGVAVAFMVTSVLLIKMYEGGVGRSEQALGGKVINEMVNEVPVNQESAPIKVEGAPVAGSSDVVAPVAPPVEVAPNAAPSK